MKNIRYFFEYIIISLLFILFKFIGYQNSSNIGAKIGKIFGPIFRSKNIIKKNLEYAGIKNESEQKKVMEEMWENYGRILAEYPFLKKFKTNELKKYITIEGQEYIADIKSKNKKAVFVSGHFNNFELMAMQLENLGIDLAAIYRPLNNFLMNKKMEKIRINHICKKQIKKGKSGLRDVLKYLKQDTSIALMIDQRVSEGKKIKFFNKFALTTTIPAQIFAKYECAVIPIYIERYNKYYFKMKISKPLNLSKSDSLELISEKLNNLLEKMIMKNPSQWIWSHNRWK
tara:strand:- start:196 stop:1053 length:858 start_codon:yes stop_codon:yes gene_type:complete